MSQHGFDTFANRPSWLAARVRASFVAASGYFRGYHARPLVRPWALLAPVLVLLIALPLLRPLRHPTAVSDDEALRLATVDALVRHRSTALTSPPPDVSLSVVANESLPAKSDRLISRDGKLYSNQPPVMAVLLSAPAWLMSKAGYRLEENAGLVAYVLTVLGVTLPVAGGAGLIYRMGRLFELPRPWRAGLACATVAGSGLLTYSVVLNPHAPAAVLLLCTAACLIHVTLARLKRRSAGWVFVAGACASLAATLDPPAGLVSILFLFVICALPVTIGQRALALLAYLIGAIGPIALHASYARPVTGEILPGTQHSKWAMVMSRAIAPHAAPHDATGSSDAVASIDYLDTEPGTENLASLSDDGSARSRWDATLAYARWVMGALFGRHGLFSHFPVLLVGIAGISAVMHRHWPGFVKTLAAATGLGALLVLAFYAAPLSDWSGAMFAARWFVVFSPLLLFWCGAWVRRNHSPVAWAAAGVTLAFSITVSLVGMSEPYPRDGFDRYTAVQALQRAINPGRASAVVDAAR
jgi:hypothetical protein